MQILVTFLQPAGLVHLREFVEKHERAANRSKPIPYVMQAQYTRPNNAFEYCFFGDRS